MHEAQSLPVGVCTDGEIIEQSESIELDDPMECGCAKLIVTEALEGNRRRATCACGASAGVVTYDRADA